MDPLSITASVVGLTATCVQVAQALNNLRQKQANASMTISALIAETTVISASLSQIQNLLLRDPDFLKSRFDDRPDLESTFDVALTGCVVVYSVLQAEIQRMGLDDGNALSRTTKLRYAWNEDNLKELLIQVRGQETGISLLVQLLQIDSLSDMRQVVQNNTTVLEQMVKRTRYMRSTNAAVKAPESIYSTSYDVYSVSLDTTSLATSTEFQFDDLVVNSRVYRKALQAANEPLHRENSTRSFIEEQHSLPPQDSRNIDELHVPLDDLVITDTGNNVEGLATIPPTTFNTDPSVNTLATRPEKWLDSSFIVPSSTRYLPTRIIQLIEEAKEDNRQTRKILIHSDWLTTSRLSPSELNKISKYEIELQNQIQEFIDLEDDYVHELKIFDSIYQVELFLMLPQLFIKESQRFQKVGYFDTKSQLIKVQETSLLSPLQRRREEQSPFIQSISDILLQWIPQAYNIYFDFATRFPKMLYTFQVLSRTAPDFKVFLQHAVSMDPQRRDWTYYLHLPILRLQRYGLLLATIAGTHGRAHPDRLEEQVGIVTCVGKIREWTSAINTAFQEASEQMPWYEILDRLDWRGSAFSFSTDVLDTKAVRLLHHGRVYVSQHSELLDDGRKGDLHEAHLVLLDTLVLTLNVTKEDVPRYSIRHPSFDITSWECGYDKLNSGPFMTSLNPLSSKFAARNAGLLRPGTRRLSLYPFMLAWTGSSRLTYFTFSTMDPEDCESWKLAIERQTVGKRAHLMPKD